MRADDHAYLTFRVSGVAASVQDARHSIRALLERADIDPWKIELAVGEAISNAVQHGYRETSGWVEIELSIDALVAAVVVRDFGAGFAASPASDGLGLGLALMESLANRLEVEGAPGAGTTVRMEFALPPADDDDHSLSAP